MVQQRYTNNSLKVDIHAQHAAPVMQVMELMVRDMGQLTHIECSVKRAKWTQVLAVLKLSPTQQDQLMANRKEHLNKLRKVYQERQELNMQVGACSFLDMHAHFSTSRCVLARSSQHAGGCMLIS